MINWFFVKHLLKHYWSATRIDVLHSPFVYNLYCTCIKPQNTPNELFLLKQLRASEKKNKALLTQFDLGASGKNKIQRKKPVRFFAKNHAQPFRISNIIFRLINQYQYKNTIELGTSIGMGAIAIALANSNQLITIEGAPEIAEHAQQNFNKIKTASKITLLQGDIDEQLPNAINLIKQVDMALIDGNHTYEATINYFNTILPATNATSLLVFDDIYWSAGMKKAWEEIKQHPSVTVTVDLFFIGLVFFRTEQHKEHFKLRVW